LCIRGGGEKAELPARGEAKKTNRLGKKNRGVGEGESVFSEREERGSLLAEDMHHQSERYVPDITWYENKSRL